jgi:hypothetical protein
MDDNPHASLTHQWQQWRISNLANSGGHVACRRNLYSQDFPALDAQQINEVPQVNLPHLHRPRLAYTLRLLDQLNVVPLRLQMARTALCWRQCHSNSVAGIYRQSITAFLPALPAFGRKPAWILAFNTGGITATDAGTPVVSPQYAINAIPAPQA